MKGNDQFTVSWYRKKQLVRLASLLPEEGVELPLFIYSIDEDIQCFARQYIKERKLLIQEGTKVRALSPLLFYGIKPTEEQVLPFLTNLYSILDSAITKYAKPDYSTQEKVEKLREYSRDLRIADLSPPESAFLDKVDQLLAEFDRPRLGENEHLEEDIREFFEAAKSIYIRRFGDERKISLNAFHESEGNAILKVFNKCINEILVTPEHKERLLSLSLEYYDLLEAEPSQIYDDMIETGTKLLALLEGRNAEPSELWWVHLTLSEAYLMTYKTNPDWDTMSNHHLAKGCEYAHMAYETCKNQEE